MFKSTKTNLLLLLTISLSLFIGIGCQKDFTDDGGSLPITTQTSVEGRVTDEGGMPVASASVRAGLNTTQTDKNGMFKIVGAAFTTSETFVTVTKPGYFKGSRTFFSRDNSNNFLKIELLRKSVSARITASAGGDVEMRSDGGSIHFEPNSFATASGALYNGTVLVATQYLDPTDPSINDKMPGDLRGSSTSGSVVGLKSYGMLAVELMDEAGQPLQIKSGSNATLTVNIPASQMAAAPATIPLWYFNDSTGLWKQEGSATKQGDSYVGNVNHFSFWNCDDPFEYVEIQARIINNAGLPVSAAKVKIEDATGNSAYDYTDNNGNVDGFVPKNKILTITVMNNCDQVVYSNTIGPFLVETNLGNITIAQNTTTIFGTVVNCTGGAVTNGYVQISISGFTEFAAINNGSFTHTFISCLNLTTAQIIAVDNGTQLQGNPQTVSLTSNNVNAGQLTACGVSSATFFTLNIGGVALSGNGPEFYRNGWKDIYGDSTASEAYYTYAAYDSIIGKYIFIQFEHPINFIFPVPYSTNTSTLFMGYAGLNNTGEVGITPLNNTASINFTEYGNLGQFISGNYSGQVVRETYDSISSTTDTVNAVFNFRVRHITPPF